MCGTCILSNIDAGSIADIAAYVTRRRRWLAWRADVAWRDQGNCGDCQITGGCDIALHARVRSFEADYDAFVEAFTAGIDALALPPGTGS